MEFNYCERWFRAQKRLTKQLSPEQARLLHDARRLYTVLWGAPESPQAFLELNGDYIGVEFLDGRLRSILCYTFEEIETGRVFLSEALWREFVADTDQVRTATTYRFDRSGHVQIARDLLNPPSRETATGQVDVSVLWDSYPAFGRYNSLVRWDRIPTNSDGLSEH